MEAQGKKELAARQAEFVALQRERAATQRSRKIEEREALKRLKYLKIHCLFQDDDYELMKELQGLKLRFND